MALGFRSRVFWYFSSLVFSLWFLFLIPLWCFIFFFFFFLLTWCFEVTVQSNYLPCLALVKCFWFKISIKSIRNIATVFVFFDSCQKPWTENLSFLLFWFKLYSSVPDSIKIKPVKDHLEVVSFAKSVAPTI